MSIIAAEILFIDIPPERMKTCTAKAEVTAFVYKLRDKVSMKDSLTVLKRDWNAVWVNEGIKRSSYIDMQRIIRDAYRTNKDGKYKKECCTDEIQVKEIQKEVITCISGLQF